MQNAELERTDPPLQARCVSTSVVGTMVHLVHTRVKTSLRPSFCHPLYFVSRGAFLHVPFSRVHFEAGSFFCHPALYWFSFATTFFGSVALMTAYSRPEFSEHDDLSRTILRKRARRLAIAAAVRRRQVVAAMQFSSAGQGPQGAKRCKVSQFSWTDHVLGLTEREFKMRYRLDFDAFRELVKIIRPDLTVSSQEQARRAKWGQVVRPESKVAIALRFLAGGSPLDLKLIYDVSISYVYYCVWLVVDAINKRLTVEFPLDDVNKLRKLEGEWRAQALCPGWKGQVAALDGVLFPMLCPSAEDVEDPMRYFVARKDKYGLLAMALCDARRRFLWYDMSQVSQTHDSLAFACTKLGQHIQDGHLPDGFFINADSAFSLTNSIICPSGGAQGLDDFDYHQSSNRVPIECAFGILVRRWPILWKPLQVKFSRRAPLIGACMRLHNFCIDHNVTDETCNVNGLSQIQPARWALTPLFGKNGEPVEYMDIEKETAQRRRMTASTASSTPIRDMLVQAIAESGLRRPALPTHAVRKMRKRKGGNRRAVH